MPAYARCTASGAYVPRSGVIVGGEGGRGAYHNNYSDVVLSGARRAIGCVVRFGALVAPDEMAAA